MMVFGSSLDDLHVSRHGEVRHPGAAKVQQLSVIQRAVRLAQ